MFSDLTDGEFQWEILISIRFGISVFVTPGPGRNFDGTGWSAGVME